MSSSIKQQQLLLHPIIFSAIVVLVLNDHVLKAAYPSWITGKLSDFAGMVFFPVLLLELVSLLRRRRLRRVALAWACVATGIAFALTNTIPMAETCYEAGLGALQWPWHALVAKIHGAGVPAFKSISMVLDPTDLIALPALLVPLWVHAHVNGRQPNSGERQCLRSLLRPHRQR